MKTRILLLVVTSLFLSVAFAAPKSGKSKCESRLVQREVDLGYSFTQSATGSTRENRTYRLIKRIEGLNSTYVLMVDGYVDSRGIHEVGEYILEPAGKVSNGGPLVGTMRLYRAVNCPRFSSLIEADFWINDDFTWASFQGPAWPQAFYFSSAGN